MKILLLILTTAFSVQCYNILCIFGYPGYSHFVVYEPIIKALSDKGHNLTVLSYFPLRNLSIRKNYREMILKEPKRFDRPQWSLEWTMKGSYYSKYFRCHAIVKLGEETCREVSSATEYRELLQNGDNYDIIITEVFNTHCLIPPLMERYQIPFIGLTAQALHSWTIEMVGNPDNPSYSSNLLSGWNNDMSFFQRLENMLMNTMDIILFEYWRTIGTQIVKQNLDKHSVPSGDSSDISHKPSVILTNTHFSLQLARPLVPNIVEIGGIHIGEEKRLPEHLDKWINESEHGVIYFSLGSMIKGHTFPEEKKQMFINVFNRLPQRVLWKWENETMSGKTDNIMIEKWMPQFDILCHPNVKVFIAHGGMLGVTEAVHCGVPMVIMPQFGDQFTNAKAVEANGGGVILDYRYLDEESIYNSLTTALDPKFNKKAKELSARFKDRPLPPLETAIYWIEYVARHGGAPHLKTAAVGMPLYQYLLLDVIAFLAVIFFSVIFIVYYISRAILKKLCGCRQSAQKLKKN